MKKLLLILTFVVIALSLINYCSDDSQKPKKEYRVSLADGTEIELFDVGEEMEFVSTSRKLKTEEYQKAADLFHFPKSKMVYFHLQGNLAPGQHYGTLYMDAATENQQINSDTLTPN